MSKIVKINLLCVDEFKNHPYKVKKDEELKLLAESIKRNGLIHPLIVRRKEADKNVFNYPKGQRYKMISGHRRRLALLSLGITEADAYVYDLTDDEATIMMVDSNIHREEVLPSEKAFAYRMKYEAMKHQGKALGHFVPKSTADEIGDDYGESGRTIKRYIRLTYLIPELLKLVDNSYSSKARKLITMKISVATEISYLKVEEQKLLLNVIEFEECTPNLSQAQRIRKLSQERLLDFGILDEILTELKGNQKERIAFSKERFEQVLPRELINKNILTIESYVLRAIKYYMDHDEGKKECSD